MLYIYSWQAASEGAKLLKEALGIQRIKNEGSRFKGAKNKTVINWGSSEVPREVAACTILNSPAAIHSCSNKLNFFRMVSDVDDKLLPPWTTNLNDAIAWTAEGSTVCARTVLQGHSAEGLVLMDRDHPESFVRAPLYTKYIKKDEEYRVHVANGDIIAIQRKVLKKEKAESGEVINWKVRNLDNGFIYQRENINPSDEVRKVAVEAMKISGLTFGAVDVIFNAKQRRAYVLEVNTAPGITGTTVDNYADAFRRYL